MSILQEYALFIFNKENTSCSCRDSNPDLDWVRPSIRDRRNTNQQQADKYMCVLVFIYIYILSQCVFFKYDILLHRTNTKSPEARFRIQVLETSGLFRCFRKEDSFYLRLEKKRLIVKCGLDSLSRLDFSCCYLLFIYWHILPSVGMPNVFCTF